MKEKIKIAVIGTGIMGTGLASNFLKNGYEVYAWNRNPKKLLSLKRQGAIIAKTPKEATENANLVFEVTANDASSKAVWTGQSGILAGATKDKVLVTNATLSVKWTTKLIKLNSQKGFTFLDMPMTGGRQGAEKGELILLAGGNEKVLNKIKPDLKAISREVLYFGKVGSGMEYKLLLNSLQAIHVLGLGEVLKIAKARKMDLKKVGEALSRHPGGTATNMALKYFAQAPDPINFSVRWIAKDLGYAEELAQMANLKTNTPLLKSALAKFKQAIKTGQGDKDWTIVNSKN